jgi:N-dimethylarginine dimethylaminohydrolase
MAQINGREGTPLPTTRRSQEFKLTEYDAWQERQRGRNWTLNDVPFYKGKGKSLEQNPFDWHNYDYLNYYDQVFGRKCGSAGIGRLREVGILEVTPDDNYTEHPYYKEDPGYMDRDGFFAKKVMDLPKMRAQQARYAETLEKHGVKVYWIKYPERPMAAYGPMTNQMSAAELTVLPGGSIIAKKAYALAPTSGFGRTEYLARWAFWNLGIPVLVAVVGKGSWVTGVFMADDFYCQTMSVETNEEGMAQVEPVMKRVCGEKLHVQRIYVPTYDYFDRKAGTSAHTDMVIAPLDIDTCLVHAPAIDVDTHAFLWNHGYKIIEADHEEQCSSLACNLIPIEPGLVLMHAAAKNTIAKVRQAGIEVVPIEYDEYNAYGAGLHCATMQIQRDPGPRKFG